MESSQVFFRCSNDVCCNLFEWSWMSREGHSSMAKPPSPICRRTCGSRVSAEYSSWWSCTIVYVSSISHNFDFDVFNFLYADCLSCQLLQGFDAGVPAFPLRDMLVSLLIINHEHTVLSQTEHLYRLLKILQQKSLKTHKHTHTQKKHTQTYTKCLELKNSLLVALGC